jgi:DNA ligase 1
VRYLIVAEAYRDLEQLSSRLALTERLAALLADTPAELLPTVCYLCQGLIAPEFAGIDLGVAEKLAVRAVATVVGTDAARVAALVREAGDLGQAVERLLLSSGDGAGGGAVALEVAEMARTLREIAVAEGAGSQGRKLELLGGLAAVERLRVEPGNPVRVMLAQRLADAGQILGRLGGRCAGAVSSWRLSDR